MPRRLLLFKLLRAIQNRLADQVPGGVLLTAGQLHPSQVSVRQKVSEVVLSADSVSGTLLQSGGAIEAVALPDWTQVSLPWDVHASPVRAGDLCDVRWQGEIFQLPARSVLPYRVKQVQALPCRLLLPLEVVRYDQVPGGILLPPRWQRSGTVPRRHLRIHTAQPDCVGEHWLRRRNI